MITWSRRQHQIVEQLVTGKTTKEIAYEIGISVRTCEGYVVDIYRKLGVRSRAECIVKLFSQHQ